jgi:monothiol glutaredoxin
MTLPDPTRQRIQSAIDADEVVLFMKGNRQIPQCGFSAQLVSILDQLLPSYTTVDVLQDPEIRQGIKLFSDWPTIPQLYVRGEFLGGFDIVTEMYQTGELAPALRRPDQG